MHLQITALDMRYSFETHMTSNILKAVLPGGRQLEFEVSEAEVAALIEADATKETETQPYQHEAVDVADDSDRPVALIRWMELPDHILAPFLKAELQAMNMPDELLEQDLVDALKSITDGKRQEIVEQKMQLGVVERGVPLPQQPRTRRIESDERGNPVVEQRQQAVMVDQDEDTGARSI